MSVEIVGAEAFADLGSYFEDAPQLATTAARMAINTVISRDGMKLLREAIEEEVAFPKGYVNSQRLFVRKKAYQKDLEAVIQARWRPTSLARFARGNPPVVGRRHGGVNVMVKPGSQQHMPSAFLLRLRAGATVSDDNNNIGLAIRLKPGQRLRSKRVMSSAQLGHNLYLLYGPSVDQVFRSVAGDQAPRIVEKVETEFLRNFVRLSKAA